MSVAGGGPAVEVRAPNRRDSPPFDLPARPLDDYNFTIFVNKADTGAAMNNNPIFHEPAVCLTKFGPESGETANAILARKDWERKSGTANHANEFWWGIGEKGTAESIRHLVEMSCTRFRRHRVRCFMEQEVCHGETAVYPGVQA
jgi:hypothetical protein